MSEACSVIIRFSCVNYHDERPFWHHLLCYLLTATLSTSTYAIVSVTCLGRCKCHNCTLLLELHYKQQWQFTRHEPILINYSMSDQNRLYLLPHMLWAIFRNGYVNKKIICFVNLYGRCFFMSSLYYIKSALLSDFLFKKKLETVKISSVNPNF